MTQQFHLWVLIQREGKSNSCWISLPGKNDTFTEVNPYSGTRGSAETDHSRWKSLVGSTTGAETKCPEGTDSESEEYLTECQLGSRDCWQLRGLLAPRPDRYRGRGPGGKQASTSPTSD